MTISTKFADLNENQLKACFFNKGACLLIAVAGSGKTKTLVSRVARLIQDGVPPENIVLVTFTNKAAKEMMHRVASYCGENTSLKVNAGTFHSFALKYLKKITPSNMNKIILDTGDACSAIQLVKSNLELSSEFLTLFKKAEHILEIISFSKNTLTEISSLLDPKNNKFGKSFKFKEDILKVAKAYELYKENHNMMDFDDILLKFISEMENNALFRSKMEDICEYLMVDEYQDTNALQAKMCNLLCAKSKNIMVVGDDAQSIYSFRGADVLNIFSFKDQWPNCEYIVLDYNYRSTQPILNIANCVLQSMSLKFEKSLKAHSTQNQIAAELPILKHVFDQDEQARFIIGCIKSDLQKGIAPNDISVLIKANYQGVLIEKELVKNKIEYVKYGGLRFVELAHVKDFMAMLRLLLNSKDELAYYRLLTAMPSVGEKTVKAWWSSNKTFFEAIKQIKKNSKTEKTLQVLEQAEISLNTSKNFETTCKIVQKVINHVIDLNYDPLEWEDRKKDIQVLVDISSEYSSSNTFLADFSLDNSTLNEPSKHSHKIILSTIHSAKGLEFHSVYVPNATEDTYSAMNYNKTEQQTQEGHRLFYVLVTRAKKQLTFVAPSLNFKKERVTVSSYLKLKNVKINKA